MTATPWTAVTMSGFTEGDRVEHRTATHHGIGTVCGFMTSPDGGEVLVSVQWFRPRGNARWRTDTRYAYPPDTLRRVESNADAITFDPPPGTRCATCLDMGTYHHEETGDLMACSCAAGDRKAAELPWLRRRDA